MNSKNDPSIGCARCGEPCQTRGLCGKCYQKARYSGEIEIRQRDVTRSYLVRLLANIKGRCENPNVHKFKYYGGKGIKSDLTLDDLRFLYERDHAHLLERPSIDRIDPNGNYSVGNCRFIEYLQNCKNRIYIPKATCRLCGKIEVNCGRYRYRCADCRALPKTADCKVCSLRFVPKGRETICLKCRVVTRPCCFCGRTITRDVVANSGCMRNKQWFCTKSEQGKWIGANRRKAA